MKEDRTFGGNKPFIDLVPWEIQQCGGSERIVEGHLGKDQWERIRGHIASRAGNACELCHASPAANGVLGKRAFKFRVEFRFEHDRSAKVSILRRLVHVCVGCSQATHLRLAQMTRDRFPAGSSPYDGALARLEHFHHMSHEQIAVWLKREVRRGKEDMEAGFPKNLNLDILDDDGARLWQ